MDPEEVGMSDCDLLMGDTAYDNPDAADDPDDDDESDEDQLSGDEAHGADDGQPAVYHRGGTGESALSGSLDRSGDDDQYEEEIVRQTPESDTSQLSCGCYCGIITESTLS